MVEFVKEGRVERLLCFQELDRFVGEDGRGAPDGIPCLGVVVDLDGEAALARLQKRKHGPVAPVPLRPDVAEVLEAGERFDLIGAVFEVPELLA